MGEDIQITGADADPDIGWSYDDLMAEIYRDFHIPEIGPGEFTIAMYSEHYGIARTTAEREIEAAVKAGVLEEAGDRMYNGKRSGAYRRKKSPGD